MAALASMKKSAKSKITPPSRALHRYALICAGATLCLIFIGGLVTTTGSALAVPDWPLAFGHLVPKLVGGVRFEYGHRVAAATVSILTLILAVWTVRVEERRWVRNLALGAFGLIIVQAVLGGITVLLELPLAIAVAHAATAQAFFCVIVTIAAVTNRRFEENRGSAENSGRRVAPWAIATTAIIYGQILIGAVMRHLGAGLVIPDFPLSYGHLIPPLDSIYVDINFAHRCGALVVVLMVLIIVAKALRSPSAWFRGPAIGLVALLALQISLGALTIWSHRAIIPTTAHVATGAAVLATSLLLAIRTYAAETSLKQARSASVREFRPMASKKASA